MAWLRKQHAKDCVRGAGAMWASSLQWNTRSVCSAQCLDHNNTACHRRCKRSRNTTRSVLASVLCPLCLTKFNSSSQVCAYCLFAFHGASDPSQPRDSLVTKPWGGHCFPSFLDNRPDPHECSVWLGSEIRGCGSYGAVVWRGKTQVAVFKRCKTGRK